MKIAVVYNRASQKVINLFGLQNREKYGEAAIKRVVNSLRQNGHQVIALEGDKDLIDNLEDFMPQAIKGEQLGMVFNLAYGIQGQARYSHVPSILEMVGVPYVGSGPLAHSLALDKVVAKMLFQQHGIPTPAFCVLETQDYISPDMAYPLIVKPKNESVSFGIQIVHNEQELREAAEVLFAEFKQAILVEQYIEGREINVGIIGNGALAEVLSPAELVFGDNGPRIYTLEDKQQQSARRVGVQCPADLSDDQTQYVKEISLKAFNALGCYDCARVDLRMDEDGNFYILEVNSLPSLGEHGSYVAAAESVGLAFPDLVNRLVDVAAARYFGTPNPPDLSLPGGGKKEQLFQFLTSNRDNIERDIEQWVSVNSRTNDSVGIKYAANSIGGGLKKLGLSFSERFSDQQDVWCWESKAGMDNGTLIIVQLDVPVTPELASEHFRRDPEKLFGEGIGSSRAPLVTVEYALRALKKTKSLNGLKLGVLIYADEGRDCDESAHLIRSACQMAQRVLVLDAAHHPQKIRTSARGQRRFRVTLEGKSLELGQRSKQIDLMQLFSKKMNLLTELNDKGKRTAISVVDVNTDAYPRRLPHRVSFTIQTSFPDRLSADRIEEQVYEICRGGGVKWHIAQISDRPAFIESRQSKALFQEIVKLGSEWELPLKGETSLWPSVAGLVPQGKAVICGLAPAIENIATSVEAISRISFVERMLLLGQLLLHFSEEGQVDVKASGS